LLAAALHWAGGDTERSRTLALEITAAVPDHARAAWYVDARPKSAKKEAPSAGDEDAGGGDGDFAALLAGASKLRNRGRTKKALEAYDRALELQPENIRASLGKAWCLFDLERTAEALELFFAVVEAKPRMAPAIIGLAQALEAAGRARDARVYYERYLELEPAGPDAPVARAALERAAGE
jgi:tetratricopeptide (TPR) repeat protein